MGVHLHRDSWRPGDPRRHVCRGREPSADRHDARGDVHGPSALRLQHRQHHRVDSRRTTARARTDTRSICFISPDWSRRSWEARAHYRLTDCSHEGSEGRRPHHPEPRPLQRHRDGRPAPASFVLYQAEQACCPIICRPPRPARGTISTCRLDLADQCPQPWPANKSIDSMSPLASPFGGSPMNRSTGMGCPPTTVWPTAGSSGRDSWPRASWSSHCCTNAVRKVRCGALGCSRGQNRMVPRTVSPSSASSSPLLVVGVGTRSRAAGQKPST